MNWELWGILVGGFCVLAIYSFLWKENRFYRFFEHLYIGVATGYGVVETISNFVWPDWLKPSLGLDLQPWESYQWWKAYLFVAAAIGLLMYFMLSRKHNWIARIVIGLGLGIAGGMAFQGFFGGFFPTLVDSFRPVLAHSFDPATGQASLNWWLMAGNVLFLLTLVCVMTYFFFSFEHSKPAYEPRSPLGAAPLYAVRSLPSLFLGTAGAFVTLMLLSAVWPKCPALVWIPVIGAAGIGTFLLGLLLYKNRPLLEQASSSGRWLMMVTFGAFFGSTVMARMALLIDRLQFMIHDWFRTIQGALGG